MQTNFRGRDFIGDLDFTKEEIETVLDIAWDLKRKRALGQPHAYLRDKVLAMLFFFSSTRTRGSFEAGMAQLGGHGAFIDSNTTQISHGDTPVDPHSAFTHLGKHPIDGGLVDGPVYTSIYKNLIGITLYEEDEYAAFQSDLAVYHDDYGDYSTNEPTMDGTASLVYLLGLMAK